MISEVFWTGLYTSAIGLIIAVSSQCYKSKCKEVSCCCIKIIRDVQIEDELDIQQPRNPINTEPGRLNGVVGERPYSTEAL